MRIKHLTDEELQTYLSGDLACEPEKIEAHLEMCSDCRDALEEYRYIFGAIETEPVRGLSADFAARVADKVWAAEVEPKVARKTLWTVLSIVSAAAVLVMFTLSGWSFWPETSQVSASTMMQKYFGWFGYIVGAFSSIDSGSIFLIVGTLIAGFYGMLDKLVERLPIRDH